MRKIVIAAVLTGLTMLCTGLPIENATAEALAPNASTLSEIKVSDDPVLEALDAMNEPDMEEVRKKVESVLPILDSIVRTMEISSDTEYAPEDTEFFWTALYLMGNNWGTTHPLVAPGGDSVAIGATHVPTHVMEQFAGAAFATFTSLPPIPESLQSSIWLDEGNDVYVHEPSDMRGTVTKVENVSIAQDGSVIATVGLYDGTDEPEGIVRCISFTLIDHPSEDGVNNSIYQYSVTGAKKEPK